MPSIVSRAMRTAYRIAKNLNSDCVASYSQEGEDMILRRTFKDRRHGFYVDIGAFHPRQFSNTYYFYNRGWTGISVDARPGYSREFSRARPRDRVVEAAISDREQTLTYTMFNEPALNGFRSDLGFMSENPHWKVVAERSVKTTTLMQLLDAHLPSGQRIDFMSVDVEGHDLAVLTSNDWSKYRPLVVLAEDLAARTIDKVLESDVYRFLVGRGYAMYAKTVNTMFFADPSQSAKADVELHL
jgi:FkbM family methyltransferase